MDSLTQIVLGAACGEAVAGRKLGNRAMLWGAIGGTIPDLDVFAGFFTDEITATAFHRGFMHSFLFAGLTPWIFAWLARRFYERGLPQRRGFRLTMAIVWLLLCLLATAGLNLIPLALGAGLKWYVMLPTTLLAGLFIRFLWVDYLGKPGKAVPEASYGTWVLLFFTSIFTHPVLDSFTNFGTQVWQPFSDYRVQWNTVSVVDPGYTLPFMAFLIIAMFFGRSSRTRLILCWIGIVWSCGYLAFTYWHKQRFNTIFEKTLADKGLSYKRYMSNPTIFNNTVWYGLAETDTTFYFGLYGFNDREEKVQPLSIIPKNREMLAEVPPDSRAMRFLNWFSDGYYNVVPYKGDTLQVNDLRFGLIGDSLRTRNYVFPFLLFKNEKGEWDVKQNNRNRESVDENKDAFGQLFKRVLHGRQN